MCFWADPKKKMTAFASVLAQTFSNSPLNLLNGILENLTLSKISTLSTKFVFFWPISKQKWSPWPIHLKGSTLYSGAQYVARLPFCYFEQMNARGAF